MVESEKELKSKIQWYLNAIKTTRPKRVYEIRIPLSPDIIWSASFIAPNGDMYRYDIGDNWGSANNHKKTIIHGSIEANVETVEGRVRKKDRTIYHIFETTPFEYNPEETEKRKQRSYESWLRAIKSLPKNSKIYYAKVHIKEPGLKKDTSEGYIVDAVHEEQHHIIQLDLKQRRTLKKTLAKLSEFGNIHFQPLQNLLLDNLGDPMYDETTLKRIHEWGGSVSFENRFNE